MMSYAQFLAGMAFNSASLGERNSFVWSAWSLSPAPATLQLEPSTLCKENSHSRFRSRQGAHRHIPSPLISSRIPSPLISSPLISSRICHEPQATCTPWRTSWAASTTCPMVSTRALGHRGRSGFLLVLMLRYQAASNHWMLPSCHAALCLVHGCCRWRSACPAPNPSPPLRWPWLPAGVCNAVLLPVVQEFNAQARQCSQVAHVARTALLGSPWAAHLSLQAELCFWRRHAAVCSLCVHSFYL